MSSSVGWSHHSCTLRIHVVLHVIILLKALIRIENMIVHHFRMQRLVVRKRRPNNISWLGPRWCIESVPVIKLVESDCIASLKFTAAIIAPSLNLSMFIVLLSIGFACTATVWNPASVSEPDVESTRVASQSNVIKAAMGLIELTQC